jgi:hypothetical protein
MKKLIRYFTIFIALGFIIGGMINFYKIIMFDLELYVDLSFRNLIFSNYIYKIYWTVYYSFSNILVFILGIGLLKKILWANYLVAIYYAFFAFIDIILLFVALIYGEHYSGALVNFVHLEYRLNLSKDIIEILFSLIIVSALTHAIKNASNYGLQRTAKKLRFLSRLRRPSGGR